MPKAIKKRVRKKEVEVEVQDRISDIREMMQAKQKAVITYGGIAAVAVLAVVGILFFRYTNQEKAGQLAYEAYKIYYNENQKSPLPKKEQYDKAAELFSQAYAKQKSPRLLLYVASCYTENGRLDDALKTLNTVVSSHSADKNVLPIAYRQIANLHLKMGKQDEALKTLDTLYKTSGEIFKDAALIESARILESAGKKDEATAKYKELMEKFKTSPYADEAKAKLGISEKKEG